MRKVLAVLVVAFAVIMPLRPAYALSVSELWSYQNYLAPGQTASFLFDLTSQIPVDGTFVQPYAVQAAHISFAFSSPSFPVYQSGPLYGGYTYTGGSTFSPSYTRTATTYYSDALDSASIQIGSQAFNANDSANYSRSQTSQTAGSTALLVASSRVRTITRIPTMPSPVMPVISESANPSAMWWTSIMVPSRRR